MMVSRGVTELFGEHGVDVLRLHLLLGGNDRLGTLLLKYAHADLEKFQLSEQNLHEFLVGEDGTTIPLSVATSPAALFLAIG